MAQLLPFQRSASVTRAPLLLESPTATQAVVDTQDTRCRPLPGVALGFCVVRIAQAPACQRSARVTSRPEPLRYQPTAMQTLGDGQETPRSTVRVGPPGM